MADRILTVKIVGDSSSLESAFGRASQSADTVGGKFQAVGQGLSSFGSKMTTSVTLPLVAVGVAAFSLASNAEEATNKVNVVFGESADEIHAFAESAAESLGMSSAEAESAAGTFGNLFSAMGIGIPAAVDMSTQLIQLATDLASFNNANPEQVLEALRSGLVGETEPLRQFGINLNAARIEEEALRLGLAQQGDVLDTAAKAQAAFSLIMQDSTLAQGDFARTADGAANQMRTAFAQVKDAGAQLGTSLIPVFQDLIGMVQSVANWFNELGPAMQGIVIKAGVVVAAIGPVSRVFGGLASAVGGVIGHWPKIVAAFSNPWVLLAGATFTAIAVAIGIFTGKAADAARRVDDLAAAMADGTPKAEAFGVAVLKWLEELNADQVETLNGALAEMGTNYSDLVTSVADGTLSLADFNATMNAAIAQRSTSNTVGDETITLLNSEALALRDLKAEVNATYTAMGEAERATAAQGVAMGENATLAQAMQTGSQNLAGAQGEVQVATEGATGALRTQIETMAAQISPALGYLESLQRLRDANANLVLVQGDVEASADDVAAAELDVVSAHAAVQGAAIELRNNPDALLAFREAEEAAGIATGSIETFASTLGGAFDRGDVSPLRARLLGLSDILYGVTRDVDALGSAFGRLPATVNTNVNVSVTGAGAGSFLDGRF